MNDGQAADIAKALSHPLRFELLRSLRERKDLSPVQYARETGEPLGNVSYHFGVLAKAGVIAQTGAVAETRGDGTPLLAERPQGQGDARRARPAGHGLRGRSQVGAGAAAAPAGSSSAAAGPR